MRVPTYTEILVMSSQMSRRDLITRPYYANGKYVRLVPVSVSVSATDTSIEPEKENWRRVNKESVLGFLPPLHHAQVAP
ncbi:hypothetical protein CPB83DRAFT_528780 [Crepidotus variabilis]|uniref:Uncharacterized protein n=1 Tax=Crepidotus variabilis TaxID=179855 RepID=A0A9P6EQ99_9AGAR|nr:hypothetical protein CPB83DRAFT_528780 [Crepidotus variabilis]